jgi:hypothetical protein
VEAFVTVTLPVSEPSATRTNIAPFGFDSTVSRYTSVQPEGVALTAPPLQVTWSTRKSPAATDAGYGTAIVVAAVVWITAVPGVP